MFFLPPPTEPAVVSVYLAFAMMLGACVGSFLNVCVYRIPLELSVVKPRSHCPACKALIPMWCNIPLASWLLLRGKCRACGVKISIQYFMVEALTAMLFGLVFLQWNALPPFLGLMQKDLVLLPVYMAFAASLVCASFIDLEHYILPDRITIGGTVASLLLSPLLPQLHNTPVWHEALLRSAIGAGVGFGILYAVAVLGTLIFRKEAMGFGDVKLMAFFGAMFGWRAVLFVIFFASLVGSVAGVGVIIARWRSDKGTAIPFGPHLCVAALAWLFWGPLMWEWFWEVFAPWMWTTFNLR